ncbi:MAG TPA: hypothetical protein VFQ85_11540 [Mycobacteriales bacterium]|nr:hypothetical protein [Mycobacteriales bacterium]
MKFRSLAFVATPAVAVLATVAHAAAPAAPPKPLVVTDAAGDANAINGAGVVSGGGVPEGVPTDPASMAAYDIRSVTFAATGKVTSKKVRGKTVKTFGCTGYTVAMEMAGTPSTTATLYRVQAQTPLHSTFWLQFSNPAGGETSSVLRFNVPASPTDPTATTKSVPLVNPAKVVGNKVVFTVTAADLGKAGEKLGRATITNIGADVRTATPRATAPMWDQLVTDGSQVWRVCPQ